MTDLIGIVQVHDPTSLCIHIFVALGLAAHHKCCVHVHIMACKIQGNQTLENDAVCRLCCRKEHEQARSRASIGDHVQYSSKACALLEFARRDAIEGIKQAGYRV